MDADPDTGHLDGWDGAVTAPRPDLRKPWDELAEKRRRWLLNHGYGPEDHAAGRPQPKPDTPPKPKRTRDRDRDRGRGARQGRDDEPARPSDDAPPPPRPAGVSLRDGLERVVGLVGLALYPFEPFDGTVLLSQAGDLATGLDQLAGRHPAVRRTLEAVVFGGDAFELGSAAMATAVPILLHHGLLPANPLLERTIPADARPFYDPPRRDDGPAADRPRPTVTDTPPPPPPSSAGAASSPDGPPSSPADGTGLAVGLTPDGAPVDLPSRFRPRAAS